MWRASARQGLLRALPGLVWAIISLAAFTVASGFSSRISTGISDEVIMKPDNCGYINNTATELDLTSYNLLVQDQDQKISAAANYAQQCYAANGSGVFDCNYFAISRMPTILNADASCPFAPEMCRSSDGGNMRLDTGYLSSHDHFGINAAPDERILYRHVMECAPFNTAGFESNGTADDLNVTRYNYGPAIRTLNGSVELGNWTYEMQDLEHQYGDQDSNFQSSSGRLYQLA
jgi:hypothetical protein